MRWGVTDEMLNDHQVTDLSIKEIENCQQVSCGPSFVVSSRDDIGRTHNHDGITLLRASVCFYTSSLTQTCRYMYIHVAPSDNRIIVLIAQDITCYFTFTDNYLLCSLHL